LIIGSGHDDLGRFNERAEWTELEHTHDPWSWVRAGKSLTKGVEQIRRYTHPKRGQPFPVVRAAYELGPRVFAHFVISDADAFQPWTPGGCARRYRLEQELKEWYTRYPLPGLKLIDGERGAKRCQHMSSEF
jgi:hypothetical protein